VIELLLNYCSTIREFLGVNIMYMDDLEKAAVIKPYESYFQQMIHDLQKSKIYQGSHDKIILLTDVLVTCGDFLKRVP
jgi:hypothetical protein